MAVHFVTGKTTAEASDNLRQALMLAKDGDQIELDYGIECQGPFLIWSRVEIVGQDAGAHTLFATQSPVLSIAVPGVTLRELAVHYVGSGEGIAIKAVAGSRPALVNVDIEGQVNYAGSTPANARAVPVADMPLDFGTVEQPDRAPVQPVQIRNTGSLSWKYAAHAENWLEVTPSGGYLHPDQEQTLHVRLTPNIKALPVDQWLEYPAGIQLQGTDVTLDIPVRLFYQPPAPKLTRLPLANNVALQMDTSAVVFAPGHDWSQVLARRLRNESTAPVRLSVGVPAWLDAAPAEVTIAPHETISLMLRPNPAAIPVEAKALRGIVVVRDDAGNTLTMISTAFDYTP